jgi:4-amino-4-deoxy-L-arabinose transferase-like glycosyltransferase
MPAITGEENVKKDLFPSLVLIAGSILLMALSQFIRIDVPREFRTLPGIMVFVGLALFFFGVLAAEKNGLPNWLEKVTRWPAEKLRVSQGQVLLLFFSLIFAILAVVAAGLQEHMWSPEPALFCWALGILLAAAGGIDARVKKQKIPTAIILAGMGLFAAALALRAFNTKTIPIVLSGDEASCGLSSLNFLNGTIDNIFVMGWFSFPSLHNYLQSISIALFGQTTQALRMLSALVGALTVMVVFFVGRSMYGTATGLMAGIFLAGMHFHNHFSRIGLNNIWDGLFFVLVLGFLWIGWQKKSRAAYLVAGISLGFSQYFYTSSHLLFFIIPVWLLLAWLKDRKQFREALPGLFLMAWMALIVLLPLIWFYLNRPDDLFAPMNRVEVFRNLKELAATHSFGYAVWTELQQLWYGLLAYMGTPLRAWYMPGVPILRTIPGVIFLTGLVFMVFKPRDNRNQLIFLWLLALALSGGLSDSTPAAQRYVASAPAVALMVAFALSNLGDLANRWLPIGKRWIEVALLVIVLALAADDARFYYKTYTPNSDFSGFNGMVAQTLANFLKEEPAGTEVVFCGYPAMGYDSIASLPYLAPQIKFYNVNQAWETEETPTITGDRAFFVFLPDHESDKATMETEYPGGNWSEFYTTQGNPLFSLYEYRRN